MPAAKSIAPVPRTAESAVMEHIVSLLPLVPTEMLPSAVRFLDQYRGERVGHAAVQPQLHLSMQEIILLWYFRQPPHDESRNSALDLMQACVEPQWEMGNGKVIHQE